MNPADKYARLIESWNEEDRRRRAADRAEAIAFALFLVVLAVVAWGVFP